MRKYLVVMFGEEIQVYELKLPNEYEETCKLFILMVSLVYFGAMAVRLMQKLKMAANQFRSCG